MHRHVLRSTFGVLRALTSTPQGGNLRTLYSIPCVSLPDLYRQFTSPSLFCVPVTPEKYGKACWAVPLWSERGLIGVLLLGEKRNNGLYTQEEIEIARSSGEHMIDTKASAELGQCLVHYNGNG